MCVCIYIYIYIYMYIHMLTSLPFLTIIGIISDTVTIATTSIVIISLDIS